MIAIATSACDQDCRPPLSDPDDGASREPLGRESHACHAAELRRELDAIDRTLMFDKAAIATLSCLAAAGILWAELLH